jgi:hypothetical protein
MTCQDIIDYCLTFHAAYEDYPFSGITGGDIGGRFSGLSGIGASFYIDSASK